MGSINAMSRLARCHYPERANLLDQVDTAFQLAEMTATGAEELPIEAGATAAVDTAIAATPKKSCMIILIITYVMGL